MVYNCCHLRVDVLSLLETGAAGGQGHDGTGFGCDENGCYFEFGGSGGLDLHLWDGDLAFHSCEGGNEEW